MKKLLSIFSTVVFLTVATVSVNAAGESNCQVIYGGGQVCPEEAVKFTINKLVQKPETKGSAGEFVENLTINDSRYSPNQNVNFKIVVENTGDRDIANLNVVDRFPEFLSFVAGVGVSNEGAKEIRFVIGNLPKGQKQEYVITARTANADVLPNNQSITCVTNNVRAVANDGASAEDNSQVCIEKGIVVAKPTPEVLGKPTVKEIPATGPELGLLASLIPMGAAGIYLRSKFK